MTPVTSVMLVARACPVGSVSGSRSLVSPPVVFDDDEYEGGADDEDDEDEDDNWGIGRP